MPNVTMTLGLMGIGHKNTASTYPLATSVLPFSMSKDIFFDEEMRFPSYISAVPSARPSSFLCPPPA